MIKNIYKVKVNFIGYYTVPDENAPAKWRGSHIYDADYPAWIEVVLHICANSFADAEEFAEEFAPEKDNHNPYTISIEELDITSIEHSGYTKDNYDPGVISVEYKSINDGKYKYKKYETQ